MSPQYRFALAFFNEDGTSLGQFPLEVDFEPATEWTRFLAARRRSLRCYDSTGQARIEPTWHSTESAPYVEGFSVELPGDGDGSGKLLGTFGASYFVEKAQFVASRLIAAGELSPAGRFFYLPLAYPLAESLETSKAPFTAREVMPSLDIGELCLEERRRGTTALGTMGEDDMPVFMPRQVLDEVSALARRAGSKETGGVLIGHLYRDPDEPEIFAEITAQVHARKAQAESNKLTFTAETWTDVRAALELRREGEIWLGYWHSHPVAEWCKKCPPEKRKACVLSRDFFSAADRALQRAVFPRAYSVALVINMAGKGDLNFSLFGWNQGVIAARGFYVNPEK